MNIGLIFAGGVGSRMGSSMPKQFLEWNGKAIIIQTLEIFDKHELIDGVVLVCKEDWIEYTKELTKKAKIKKLRSIIPGGATALDSQYNGLQEINRLYPESNPIVLIHDGVRPLVDKETITDCINCAEKKGNAITVTKAIEPLRADKKVGSSLEVAV